MADRVGQQFGNYRLTRLLGQGGFAEVYLGEHAHLGTQVAVKVLLTQIAAAEEVEKFRREAQTIATLDHPNIVRVLDFDVAGNVPYLVMDYAPNGSLRQHLPTNTPLPPTTFLPYLLHVAAALQYAHDRQLVHRDVKPENMLLGRRNEALLTDFGIAVVAQNTTQQRTQGIAGTAAYMAPEQLQGKPRPASDLYSLGIVVYEWLCGERPFQGGPMEVATQHILTPPPPLREKVPGIAPAVEQVVLTALAKEPKERFGSVRAFATAFAQAAEAPEMLSTLFTQLAGPAAPAGQPGMPLPSQGGGAIFSATTHITPQLTPQLTPQPSNPSVPAVPPQPAAARQGAAFIQPPPMSKPETLPTSAPPPTAPTIQPAARGWAAPPTPPGNRWVIGSDADSPQTVETAYGVGSQAKQRNESTPLAGAGGLIPPSPQAGKGQRQSGVWRWALLGAACLLLLALVGGGIVLGSGLGHSPTATATTPAGVAGVATSTQSTAPTAVPTSTPTAMPTSTSTPIPTDTPTFTPTLTPTATAVPIPNIAGTYEGSYTNSGSSNNYPMWIQISQSGANLSGTTNESGTVFNDTGTIDSSGNFTITENYNGGTAMLYGSIAGSGHLSGTWGSSSGTWDVYSAPSVRGTYQGSFTTNGGSGSSPMWIQLSQSGSNISGTTNESGATANDTGTIDSSGNFTITEYFSGGGTATLYGSIVDASHGHIGGTWTSGTSSGTWDVYLI